VTADYDFGAGKVKQQRLNIASVQVRSEASIPGPTPQSSGNDTMVQRTPSQTSSQRDLYSLWEDESNTNERSRMLLPGSPFDSTNYYVEREPDLKAAGNELMGFALRALDSERPNKQAFIDLFEVDLDEVHDFDDCLEGAYIDTNTLANRVHSVLNPRRISDDFPMPSYSSFRELAINAALTQVR
jgi:hypothetical protein